MGYRERRFDGRQDEIVRRYVAAHSWIELVNAPERRERHFAGKVHAFNAGYARVQNLDYEVIASMDGDILLMRITFRSCLASWRPTAVSGWLERPSKKEQVPPTITDLSASSMSQALANCFGVNVSNRSAGMCRSKVVASITLL